MEEAMKIDNRGDFGLWAIEVAKQIVSGEGFDLEIVEQVPILDQTLTSPQARPR